MYVSTREAYGTARQPAQPWSRDSAACSKAYLWQKRGNTSWIRFLLKAEQGIRTTQWPAVDLQEREGLRGNSHGAPPFQLSAEENIFLVDEILNLMVDEKVLPLKKYNARKQEILAYIPISLYEKNLSLIDDNSLYNETNHLIVREKLDNLLSVFGPRNKEILKLYFGFYDNSPLKVKEIASLYNLSGTRIERIIKVSLRILEENYGDILLSLKDMLDDDYSLTFK